MFGGPAHTAKRTNRAARPERDEPIAAILGRPEHRVGVAERVERSRQVCRASVGDVSAHDRRPPLPEPAECPIHALAEVAAALADAPDAPRSGEVRTVGRHRQHRPKAPVGCQPSQQGNQRGTVEAERRPIAEYPGEPALDRAESWGTGKNDYRVSH